MKAYPDVCDAFRQLARHMEDLYHDRERDERERRYIFGIRLEEMRDGIKRIARLHGTEIREGRRPGTTTKPYPWT